MVCEIENTIMRKVATALIEAGCYIRVYDGEEYTGKTTRDVSVIMQQVAHTDETHYSVRRRSEGGPCQYEGVGFVHFVRGNAKGN